MAVRFKQLSKNASDWTSSNPILLEGEIGFEKDTNKLKIGDGVSNWNTLEYVAESDSTTKKYLHRITLNLSDQASGSPPNKTAVIHLDYYSEQETAYTSPNFATIALASSIGCSGYYTDTDTSLTEKNFVYEIALPQSNEFILNSSFSITIQSTGSSITDEVIGYVLS